MFWMIVSAGLYILGAIATFYLLIAYGFILSAAGTDRKEAKKAERRLLWTIVWPAFWLGYVPYKLITQMKTLT